MLWQHNGHNLTDEQNDMGDIFFTTRGQRIHMLIIESVKARHMGNFSCTATNRAGRTDFTSNLVVKGSKLYLINFLIHFFVLIFLIIGHFMAYSLILHQS